MSLDRETNHDVRCAARAADAVMEGIADLLTGSAEQMRAEFGGRMIDMDTFAAMVDALAVQLRGTNDWRAQFCGTAVADAVRTERRARAQSRRAA